MFSRRTSWDVVKNAFTQAVERRQEAGAEILDLSVSNPTQAGLKLNADLCRALCDPRCSVYHPQPRGLLEARTAVVDYYRDLNAEVRPEQIVLTTSTSEGYSFLFRLLCDPGDEVLIPTPSYPLFEFLATIQDVQLVPFELIYDHGWQIDFYSLRRGVTPRTRAIILVNPNNPTGSFIKDRERSELNKICRDSGLALIADEVFFDFNLTAAKPESFVSNGESLTFTLSGLSKIAGLPQMKLAWIVMDGPEPAMSQASERLEIIADTYLSMNAPVQYAVPKFLAARKSFQDELLCRLKANLVELDRQLRQQALCSRLEVEGGWYAILRVPATRTDEALAIELLENVNVLVHPGHFFDFRSDGYLAVSLMTPEIIFAEGIKRTLKYIATTGT